MKPIQPRKRQPSTRQNCQDFAWQPPTGPALTVWRLTWWVRIRPGLDLTTLPATVVAALIVLDDYARRQGELI